MGGTTRPLTSTSQLHHLVKSSHCRNEGSQLAGSAAPPPLSVLWARTWDIPLHFPTSALQFRPQGCGGALPPRRCSAEALSRLWGFALPVSLALAGEASPGGFDEPPTRLRQGARKITHPRYQIAGQAMRARQQELATATMSLRADRATWRCQDAYCPGVAVGGLWRVLGGRAGCRDVKGVLPYIGGGGRQPTQGPRRLRASRELSGHFGRVAKASAC